jgi:hypothetical protein
MYVKCSLSPWPCLPSHCTHIAAHITYRQRFWEGVPQHRHEPTAEGDAAHSTPLGKRATAVETRRAKQDNSKTSRRSRPLATLNCILLSLKSHMPRLPTREQRSHRASCRPRRRCTHVALRHPCVGQRRTAAHPSLKCHADQLRPRYRNIVATIFSSSQAELPKANKRIFTTSYLW